MKNWREIDGWLEPAEAELLQNLVREMPEDALWCEIGSWKGKSTVAMAETGREGFAIDWFKGSYEHHPDTNTYQEYLSNIEGYENIIRTISGLSQEVAELIPSVLGVLFIDGNHDYESCKRDYELYSPKVISGGWIVFHDYKSPAGDPWPGVTKFVDELLASGEFETIQAARCLAVKKK